MIHWFDIFVVVFLFISIVWSYFRGIIKEIFSIASVVIGYLMASSYYDDAAPWMEWLTSDKSTREMVAFALLFFVSVVLLKLFSFFIQRILPLPMGLGALNRVAGSGVGLIKGVIILSVITFPLALIPGLHDDIIKNSRAAAVLVGISGAALEKLAPDLSTNLNNSGYFKKRPTGAIEEVIDKWNKVEKKVGEMKDKAVEATTSASEFVDKTVDEIKDATGKLKDKAVRVKNIITETSEKKKDSGNAITESDRNEMDTLIEQKDKN